MSKIRWEQRLTCVDLPYIGKVSVGLRDSLLQRDVGELSSRVGCQVAERSLTTNVDGTVVVDSQ